MGSEGAECGGVNMTVLKGSIDISCARASSSEHLSLGFDRPKNFLYHSQPLATT